MDVPLVISNYVCFKIQMNFPVRGLQANIILLEYAFYKLKKVRIWLHGFCILLRFLDPTFSFLVIWIKHNNMNAQAHGYFHTYIYTVSQPFPPWAGVHVGCNSKTGSYCCHLSIASCQGKWSSLICEILRRDSIGLLHLIWCNNYFS